MKLSRREWTIFCFQAGLLMGQNFLLQDVLEIIAKSKTKKKVRILSQKLSQEMQKGYTFSESVKNSCSNPAPYLLASIAAGEQSSQLGRVFKNLFHYFDGKNQLEQKLKSTSSYPLLIFILSIAMAIGLLSFIVPLMEDISDVLLVEMPQNTQRLITFVHWFSSYRWYLISGFLLSIALVFYLCYRWKYFVHLFLLHLPFVGEWIKKKELWKFFSTFSMLLKNHVSTDLALSISSETMNNSRLCEEIALAVAPLRQGKPLSMSLERFVISSEYWYSLLRTGEESNRVGQNMQFISDALHKELALFYDQWIKLTEPLLFLSVGTVVLWIVLTTYLPMLSMFQWEMMGIP